MGFRPGGNSSITEMSKSPYKLIAKVRGIGVAVAAKRVAESCFPQFRALFYPKTVLFINYSQSLN
jgi:hypothetical protein